MVVKPQKNFVLVFIVFLFLLALAIPGVGAQEDGSGDQPEPPPVVNAAAVRPSDSPYLKDVKNPPIEPITPYSGPVVGPVVDPTASITHNVVTGETEVIPSAEYAAESGEVEQQTDSFEGLAPPIASREGKESVIGADDRTRITDTGSYPWRTVVNLSIKWTSTSTGEGRCSGALIDPFHVLTAGHCVFDFGGTDDWAYSIKVFPGRDDGDLPYNYAWATYYRSYTGWTQNGNHQHDWAVITLDRNIGNFTGWMGRQTAASTSTIYDGIKNTAGYPGTPNGDATCPTWGNCLYFDADDTYDVDEYNHWYWMDSSGGMSGGPVWRYTDGNRYILTVHAYGVDSTGTNHGTRLNQDKYDRIITWLGEDTTPPTDRADLLDDGQAFSGFSPTTVTQGDSLSLYSDVRNVGTASSGSFYVSYYASTNSIISTGDYFLGSAFVSSISPFNWANADTTVSLPSSVPPGTYYVGWIIDSGGAVTEFDEGNNTSFKTGYQLTVEAPPPAGDDILWYAAGPNADWLALSNGDGSFNFLSKTINGTYTALVGNFAGNAAADVFWYKPGAGMDYLWTATSAGSFTETAVPVSGTYQALVGDFNYDSYTDIFWYAPGPTGDWLAMSNGNGTFTYYPQTVNGTYTPLVGDFNGGFGQDIFWYGPGATPDYLFTSNEDGSFTSSAVPVSGTYQPLVGDFDCDTWYDIFWYAPGPTQDYVATSDGDGTFTYISQSIGGTYNPLVGNFAGNCGDDVFWYAPGGSPDYLYTATTGGNFSSAAVPVSGTYEPFLGDFDDSDYEDIFWYAPGPGADYLALSNGNGTFTYVSQGIGGTYNPLVGDFDYTPSSLAATPTLSRDRVPKERGVEE